MRCRVSALHTSVGPARTTISAIAERADVERHTVYAHFRTSGLFRACSAHWRSQHPIPDFASLAKIEDPERRLCRALSEIYAWYESVEPHLALFFRDAPLVTAGAEALAETTAKIAALPIRSRGSGRAGSPFAPRSGTRSSSRPGARSSVGRASRGGRPSTRCCVWSQASSLGRMATAEEDDALSRETSG